MPLTHYPDESRSVAGDDAVLYDAIDAAIKVIRVNLRLPRSHLPRCPVTDIISDDKCVVARPRESKHRSVVVDVVYVDRNCGFGLTSDMVDQWLGSISDVVYQRLVPHGSCTDRHLVDVLPFAIKSLRGGESSGFWFHLESAIE